MTAWPIAVPLSRMSAPNRVVLKISGESFAAPSGFGIDSERLSLIANEIAKAADKVDLAVVVGGGNIVRGGTLAQQGQIAQATADYMGMLGTVLNGLALREALEQIGHPSRLMSALAIPSVAEPFIRNRAIRHFEKGRILVLAAGTGNPFFTTDTCASL
ncbi:MAG: UMP kinase, partial [Planctomycetota bacterium]